MAGPDAAAGSTPAGAAAARLTSGLARWRRRIARRRAVATGRRWLLVAAAVAGLGAAVGQVDGHVVVTAACAGAAAVAVGLVRVAAAGRVPIAAAARDLDATLALDEQVATALWCASPAGADGGTAGRMAGALRARLIERAAALVASAERQARDDDPPGYGEWVAVAVTAAAAATVATMSAPPMTTASPAMHPGGRVVRALGPGDGPSATAAAGGGSPVARSRAPRSGASGPVARPGSPAPGTPSPAPGSPAPGSPGGSGGRASPGSALPPGGSTVPGGSRPGGQARPGGAGHPAGPPATGLTRPASPGGIAGSASGAAAGQGSRPGAAATVAGGQAAGRPRAGTPGGDTAGTAPGGSHRAHGTALLSLPADGAVTLIILPGASGSGTGTPGRGTSAVPPEGSGGAAAAAAAAGSPGGGYVPPDANEVPFSDWELLGRYF